MRNDVARVLGVGVAGLAVLLGLPTGAAMAVTPTEKTSIAFVAPTSVKAGFGSDWTLRLKVTVDGDSVSTEDGTVDVTVAGLPGDYASGLPISGNGDVYLSPPDGRAPLGAGSHQLTAFFRPAAGSFLAASHTAKAAVVSVSALTSVAKLTVTGVQELAPRAHLALEGSWKTTTKSSPPGEWTFSVSGPASHVIETTTVAQPTSSTEPIVVPITAKLARGSDYVATAKFTPDAEVTSGLTLTQAEPTPFHTPDLTVDEALGQPIETSPALAIVAVAIPVALLVGIIVVVRGNRRRRAVPSTDDPGTGV